MQRRACQCGAILGGVEAFTLSIIAEVEHVVVEGEAGPASFELSDHYVQVHPLLVVLWNEAWKLPS
jgi:hypothetical protein